MKIKSFMITKLRRKGSFSIYIEPWHADIEDFIDLRKNTGKEEMRARDLFLALWIPDLFMERVERDEEWSLFSPSEVPGLYDLYGQEFVEMYTKAESEGKAKRKMKARELWAKILESQIETGTPYILYKDAANQKSNQKNLGTIRSSNLCLTGDTLVDVRIDENYLKITLEECVNLQKSGKEIFIKSKDINTNLISYSKITNGALMAKNSEVYEVYDEISGKKIHGTADHLVFTKNRGYVKISDLSEDDILDII